MADILGCDAIDDILLWGRNREEHDAKKKEKIPGSATITNRSPSQTPRGRGNRQI